MGKYLVRITKPEVSVWQFGKRIVLHPGDWIEVGRVEATALVGEGKAEMVDASVLLEDNTIAVVTDGNPTEVNLFFKQVAIVSPQSKADGNPFIYIDKAYTFKSKDAPSVIRNPALFVNLAERLKSVDVAVVIQDYKTTVKDTNREADATQKIVGDLRVLAFQTCVAGFSGSETSELVFAEWQRQKEQGNVHALLRAVHKIKPTIAYLPPHWGIS